MIPRVFALADTHLSLGVPERSMDRFGDEWRDHARRIAQNTARVVGPDDLLLLAGDLSWANKRRVAAPDLQFLAALPGRKICVKGNHDFWWKSDERLRVEGLEEPPVILGDGALGIAGTRGWQAPREGSEEMDRRIVERERVRLAKSLAAIEGCAVKIAMLHYPPQPFLDLLAAAGVSRCVFGHVHLRSLPEDEALVLDGEVVDGVRCWCVAADRLDFVPREIPLI